MNDFWLDRTKSPQETLEKGYELVEKALAMDDSLPWAHISLSFIYILKGSMTRRLLKRNGLWLSIPAIGGLFSICLDPALCMPAGGSHSNVSKSNPTQSQRFDLYLCVFRPCLPNAGRFEEAVSAYKKGIQRAPDFIVAHVGLGTTYSLMGREKEARAEAEEVLRINPNFSLDHFARTGLKSYKDQSEIDKIVNAMRKAGLK